MINTRWFGLNLNHLVFAKETIHATGMLRQEENLKEILAVLLKKDIRGWLPGAVMYIMAGFGLVIMCAFGIFTGNGDFAVTALSILIVALVIAIVYHLFKGANCYRRNLSDEQYLNHLCENSIESKGMLIGKMLWTWIISVITVTEYMILMTIILYLSEHKYPDDTLIIDLENLFEGAIGELSVKTIFIVYLELVFMLLGLTSLVYLAFGLCYRYFIRGKYGFIASTMTTFSMFWVFWKIYNLLVPSSGMGSVIGGILSGLILGIICTLIHVWVINKEEKKKL